jgi:hypothetical protein
MRLRGRVARERSVEVSLEIADVPLECLLVSNDEFYRALDGGSLVKQPLDGPGPARLVPVDTADDGDLRDPLAQLFDAHLP